MMDPRAKPVAIAASAMLVTSLLSVGQVKYEQGQKSGKDALSAADGFQVGSGDGTAGTPGTPGTPGTAKGSNGSPKGAKKQAPGGS